MTATKFSTAGASAAALLLVSACSFSGDSLKAPAGSATTVSASGSAAAGGSGSTTSSSASPSSSTTDTSAQDPIVTPTQAASGGSIAFCDTTQVLDKACKKNDAVYEGGRLACSTKLPKGRKVALRILKDGVEVVKTSGTPSPGGADGKMPVSGVVRVYPAALPAGIYTCGFTVDDGKEVTGSVKVKGPKEKDGISQIRFCTEPAKSDDTTASCADGNAAVAVKRNKTAQCSAVVTGAKGHSLLVRVRRAGKTLDFPFSPDKVNKNLGVITAGVDLGGGGNLRCEIHKDGKLVSVRDFKVGMDG